MAIHIFDPRDFGRQVFEIAEVLEVGSPDRFHDWMEPMITLGCRFTLANLRQGFSILTSLTRLPTAFVKIGGSFVAGIDQKQQDYVLVWALTYMSRTMLPAPLTRSHPSPAPEGGIPCTGTELLNV